ncbi:unnamed protein product [Anisakis simplex]|uniref:Uncharacterized protein n=1 Tax=Anisakis simplex TaxID=6269 RepID=A0A0M3JLR6_ANISI|nr:unnamed protein product [Anisakis simplex]
MRMPNAYEICLEANGCWRLIDPLPVIYPSTATSQQPRQQQPHPSSQPQCTTSSQNDFIQSNPSNTTNNNTASLPFTNTTNNEQQQIPTRSTAHKRERDENTSAGTYYCLFSVSTW